MTGGGSGPDRPGPESPAPRPPRLLTIAGSDSGGGAGIQADLKTFAAHGGFGMSALTAVTAQNTLGVRAIHALPPAFVEAQIDAVLEDLGVDAIKVGMLADAPLVEAVAGRLAGVRATGRAPIVVDPVMIAASGDPLLEPGAISALRDRLLPLATLITPNLPEGERLLGAAASGLGERERLARTLGEIAPAVLLKGGHADEDPLTDLLWDGERIHRFRHPRLATRATHGTGCTLSAAIAARLGRGEPLVEAVAGAIDWLHQAIARAPALGRGAGPVDHAWSARAGTGCLA
jgi:hydroxymethylpyrimidine/phosphomethylpyrimidine kinase